MAFPLLIPALMVPLKVLLIKVVEMVIVYFIYKVLMSYSSTLIDWGLSQITSNVNLSDAVVQLTGFAAWIAETMMLSQIISLFISFCLVRFLIGIVRG